MVTFNRTKQNRKKDRSRGYSMENDIIAIDKDSIPEKDRVYICSYCRRDLIRMSAEEYYCNNCQIPFWPIKQQVREKQKLTTPKGVNTETLIAYTPDPNDKTASTTLGKPQKVRGGLKELQDRGIRITNYDERDGAGKPIRHTKDEDEE